MCRSDLWVDLMDIYCLLPGCRHPPPSVSSLRLLGSPGICMLLGGGGEAGSFCPRLKVVERAQFRKQGSSVNCVDCRVQTWECFGNSRCPGAQVSGLLDPNGWEATGCLWGGKAACMSSADQVAAERQSAEMGHRCCHLNYPVWILEDAIPF